MTTTVADRLLERLREWGVEQVFGYPGDGINGLARGLLARRRPAPVHPGAARGDGGLRGRRLRQVRRPAGRVHGDLRSRRHPPPQRPVRRQARPRAGGRDRRPDQPHARWAGSYQQEVDLLSLFKDVASDYVQMVTVPEQIPNVLDRAMRIAMARRAPTAIIIPNDVQELDYEPPTHEFKMVPSSLGMSWPSVAPDDDALRAAADLLNAGSKVAILVGQGARGAAAEVEQVADLLGAGRRQGPARQGRAVRRAAVRHRLDRPARHPPQLRDDERLRHPAHDRLELPLHPVPAGPRPGPRASRSTSTARLIGMRYPYEVNLVGDARPPFRRCSRC